MEISQTRSFRRQKTLLPDMIETLRSTEVLTKEGFKVMVYCNDDPLMAKRLENAGAVAIMPLQHQ